MMHPIGTSLLPANSNMKFKTVRDGKQAVILNHLGQGRLVIGPERVFLFRERFQELKSFTADRFQYIEIQENNGTILHKSGPCQVFHNPLEYGQISSRKAECVDANHLLVVYKRLKGGESERRIVQGPALFIPEVEEWVHEFQWHGTDPDNKTRMIPGQNKFTQLPSIPENFYYNVREVRTSDDTMLTVKVMLFYELFDVIKMLSTSHDPIADLINALCADVISFVGPLSYTQFVARTDQLNSLDTYPQLQQRANRVGFNVQKVVFRGYHASDQLQQVQNQAIESRTELRLSREIADQQQLLTNLKLDKQQERSSLEQSMQMKHQTHKQKLEELKQKHKLEMEEMTLRQSLELASLDTQVSLETKQAEDKHKLQHLSNLAKVKVNLNTYLTLQSDTPAHEEIRISAPGMSKVNS